MVTMIIIEMASNCMTLALQEATTLHDQHEYLREDADIDDISEFKKQWQGRKCRKSMISLVE